MLASPTSQRVRGPRARDALRSTTWRMEATLAWRDLIVARLEKCAAKSEPEARADSRAEPKRSLRRALMWRVVLVGGW